MDQFDGGEGSPPADLGEAAAPTDMGMPEGIEDTPAASDMGMPEVPPEEAPPQTELTGSVEQGSGSESETGTLEPEPSEEPTGSGPPGKPTETGPTGEATEAGPVGEPTEAAPPDKPTEAEPEGEETGAEPAEEPTEGTPSEEPTETEAGPPQNERGESYPEIVDPRTGEPIPFPEGELQPVPQEERVPWGKPERDAFIEEWESRGYPVPEGGWGECDIHHIRPREYGGTNGFDNLVPVPRGSHQTEITPWWSGFKPK